MPQPGSQPLGRHGGKTERDHDPDTDFGATDWEPGAILTDMFSGFGEGKSKSVVTPLDVQTTVEGMCLVPGMYGGQNCNSIAGEHDSRIRRITAFNLMEGDIILYSENGKKENAKLVIYAGNRVGYTVENGAVKSVEIGRLCESLLGQYCFCILRPSVMF